MRINRVLLTSAFGLICSLAIGQVEIEESQMMHDDQQRPALKMPLAISEGQAKDYFEDFMEERYAAKVKGAGFLSGRDALTIEETVISSLSSKAMDIYAMFEEVDDENSQMRLSARYGYDLYISTSYESDTWSNLNEMMWMFHDYATESYYQALLEEQQDRLKDVKKSQSKNEKTVAKNEKTIEKNIKENEKMMKENEELRNQVERESQKLEDIKESISKSKDKLGG